MRALLRRILALFRNWDAISQGIADAERWGS